MLYEVITKSRKISGFYAPRAGLEPATLRLTAECSTIELSRNVVQNEHKNNIYAIFCQAN